MEHALKRSGWIMTLGIRVKAWSPSVLQLSYGLTRPFGNKRTGESEEDGEEQQQ
ncbi:MAG: hypothetical protein GF331_20080 [Chitinivibrionales bacterium]|nr:hypothetical protein [Chitinivibrionales bacterium]